MKDFLEFLLKNIVENQEAVSVSEESQNGFVVLAISVDPNDMGKVIGKEGRVIGALRDLVKIMAVKQGVRVDVQLLEASK